MAAQPECPLWSLLREGIDDFATELADRETDSRDVLEWLAEWGREARKTQTGLMLLSAHRAKGLEFEDVIVLDGSWDRRSKEEDQDAARRLYYVAMTRARRSLSLTSMGSTNGFLTDTNNDTFLIRNCPSHDIDVSACSKIYQTLSPSEDDLSFAGRLQSSDRSLQALPRVSTGDLVQLKQNGDHWLLTDSSGVTVCRLAKRYAPPTGARFLKGTVFAISTRFKDDSAEEYQAQLKRDEWSVVLPELVFDS